MALYRHVALKTGAAFCAIMVALSCGAMLFSQQVAAHSLAHTTSSATSYQATLVVNPATPGLPVPANFLGFSIEPTNTCNVLALAQQNPAFVQLLKNLGIGVLRFGGTTVEYTTWSPSGTPSCYWNNTVITQSLIDGIFAFANQIGWTVSWTVPLKNYDPVQFVDEALYAATSGGSTLSTLEFGNEPNRYGISFSQYIAMWETYYNNFRAMNATAPISGPGVDPASKNQGSWFTQFVNTEGAKIATATAHRYFGVPGGPHPPTIHDLLSRRIIKAAATDFKILYQVTQQQHLPLVFNETNNYDLGGQPGVSDVFASALWGADYLLTGLDNGVTQMDFHGVPNNPSGNNRGTLNYYSPINQDGTPAPLYYGILLFRYAASQGGQQVPVQLSSKLNLSAHAIIGSNGQLNLIILNKDATNAANVMINTTQAFSQATSISLVAPSLSSTTGITLGGSPVGADGTWNPSSFQPVPVNGASSSVTIPAGSAMVITYS